MLEIALALTTDCCQRIIRHLHDGPGWSTAKIARIIGMTSDYVGRIEAGKQSLQVKDLEAIAKACGCEPMELVFRTVQKDELSKEGRELHDLAVAEIERHRQFSKAMSRKPPRKRRAGTAAA